MTVAQHLLPDPIGKVHWDHIYKNLSNTASLRLSDVRLASIQETEDH